MQTNTKAGYILYPSQQILSAEMDIRYNYSYFSKVTYKCCRCMNETCLQYRSTYS